MGLFLGIDGGGTKTIFVLADKRQILATVVSPGSNIVRVGAAAARTSLHHGLRQILVAASIGPQRIAHTCAGIGGASHSDRAQKIRHFIAEIIPGPVEVVGDMVIAHHAAFGAGSGVIVISGTGSIAYGRNPEGGTARAGGLGRENSDEGSGYWVGSAALAQALESAKARASVSLLNAMAHAWNLPDRDALTEIAKSSPAPDFSMLFPAVLAAARTGNALAQQNLSGAGIVLAGLAGSVMHHLFPDAKTVPVAMSGGVFANSPEVREAFRDELIRTHPHAALDPTPVDAVNGALEMARAAA